MGIVKGYPLLERDETKGCFRIKGKRVTTCHLLNYYRNGVPREKLIEHLELTNEELDCAYQFIHKEIGIDLRRK